MKNSKFDKLYNTIMEEVMEPKKYKPTKKQLQDTVNEIMEIIPLPLDLSQLARSTIKKSIMLNGYEDRTYKNEKVFKKFIRKRINELIPLYSGR